LNNEELHNIVGMIKPRNDMNKAYSTCVKEWH
jgi:hypothetical protein